MPQSSHVFAGLFLSLSALLASASAQAGSVTGDSYRVRVRLDGQEIAVITAIAGGGALDLCAAAGSTCSPGSSHQFEWLDGDTFEVDWFDTTNPPPVSVRYEIEGADFTGFGMQAEGILGVTQRPSSLPPAEKLEIFYTRNSMTLDYAGLSPADAGDGDLGTFDVETSASLVDSYAIDVSVDGGSIFSGSAVREPGSLSLTMDVSIEWLDDESFELDWFLTGATNVVFTLTGLDFANLGGLAGTLDNVIKGSSSFPADPTVTFGPDSVTISYLGLLPGEGADGDVRGFEIETTIPPSDLYTVNLVEDAAPLGKSTSTRGAGSFNPTDDYIIRWLDEDTFEIDWFASGITDLVWTIEGLDFANPAGYPIEIADVVKGASSFCEDPTVAFTEDSVTLDYAGITDGACGDVRAFDIVLPEPATGLGLGLGVTALAGLRRRRGLGRRAER